MGEESGQSCSRAGRGFITSPGPHSRACLGTWPRLREVRRLATGLKSGLRQDGVAGYHRSCAPPSSQKQELSVWLVMCPSRVRRGVWCGAVLWPLTADSELASPRPTSAFMAPVPHSCRRSVRTSGRTRERGSTCRTLSNSLRGRWLLVTKEGRAGGRATRKPPWSCCA